jgi:dihydroorotase
VEYVPGTSGQEVTALAEVAARHGITVCAHIRLPHLLDPFQGINELIAASALTGARTHVLHIGSMAIRRMPESLALIDAARRRGIDIAADVYPYTAWMTAIESAIFEPGWQQKYELTYNDLIWVETGERMTEQTFPLFRARGGAVAVEQIQEADVRTALRHPAVCVTSDGYFGETANRHPRGRGTFSRVLGRYVREQKVLPLMAALRKMTVQPVQRLEAGAPALARKGRLSRGMDADITVFDPGAVIDRADYRDPEQTSRGIVHVVVNGVVTVRDGKRVAARGAGRAIRSGAAGGGPRIPRRQDGRKAVGARVERPAGLRPAANSSERHTGSR